MNFSLGDTMSQSQLATKVRYLTSADGAVELESGQSLIVHGIIVSANGGAVTQTFTESSVKGDTSNIIASISVLSGDTCVWDSNIWLADKGLAVTPVTNARITIVYRMDG